MRLSDILSSRNFNFWLWLLVALVFAAGIGERGPWPPDEPRFALIAKQMVDSGQWLFPMRGGELYADKPPLFMWAIAAFYQFTGNLSFAFLLPSLLAGLGTAMLVYDLTTRLADKRSAWFAVGLLWLCPQFLIQTKFAQIDMWVTFWITLGVYSLLRALYFQHGMRWFYLAFAAMGLGIISKGVGFLPLLLLLAIGLWRLKNPLLLSTLRRVRVTELGLGLLVLAFTCALWLGPMLAQVFNSQDPQLLAYRDNILLKQTAGRYADPWHHFQPWHYYLSAVIPAFWLPVLLLIAARFRSFNQLFKQPLYRVLLSWVLLVVIFFSLSPAKRGVYILPALPILVMLVAVAYRHLVLPRWLGIVQNLMVGLLSFLVLLLGAALIIQPVKLMLKLQSALGDDVATRGLGLMLLMIGLLTLASFRFSWQRGHRLVIAVGFLSATIPIVIYPFLQPQRSPEILMLKARQLADQHQPGAPIAMLEFKEQHLLYATYPVIHFGYGTPLSEQERRAWRWLEVNPDGFIIASEDLVLQCFDLTQSEFLGTAHRKAQRLLNTHSRTNSCQAPTLADWYSDQKGLSQISISKP
ncbi:MAG: glycosyltransferase family 39 protein [Gammaproteobacteria bacterium]|nr:glycosyltransferase family 39 protein [Gammaproteobacteria bacterium]